MLENQIDRLSGLLETNNELQGVGNALLEKALNAMLTSVAGDAGPLAEPKTPAAPLAAEPAKPKRGRPPAAAKAAEPTPAAATPAAPEISIDQIKKAVIKLATDKGRARAESVVGNFGVVDIYGLKAGDYPAFLAAVNTAQAAA